VAADNNNMNSASQDGSLGKHAATRSRQNELTEQLRKNTRIRDGEPNTISSLLLSSRDGMLFAAPDPDAARGEPEGERTDSMPALLRLLRPPGDVSPIPNIGDVFLVKLLSAPDVGSSLSSL
jgi:hypothetical protein